MVLGHNAYEAHRQPEMPDFYGLNGVVIEKDADNQPLRWFPVVDTHGNKIDPPEVQGKPVTHFVNHEGAWEGHLTSLQDIAEAEQWGME